jgi:hypothetical protein
MRGFLYYLLKPEPEPVGVSVEPLGEALGPRVFPDGLWVLLGEVTEAPAVPVVLPLDVEPVALPLLDLRTRAKSTAAVLAADVAVKQ